MGDVFFLQRKILVGEKGYLEETIRRKWMRTHTTLSRIKTFSITFDDEERKRFLKTIENITKSSTKDRVKEKQGI
jgi:hypothetical protein